jgi:predicted O-linked N-acetylglucosamine transferase (SPINDLY family)
VDADARALLAQAQRLHASGDRRASIAKLRETVALFPELVAAYANLAALLWEDGAPADAIEPLRRATELQPGDASLWSRLAHVQAAAGDARGCLESLARAEAAGPRDARTWAMVAALFGEYGRWAEAARAFEHAAGIDPGDGDIAVRLAHAYQHEGRLAQAEAALARTHARRPDDLGVAVERALLLPQVCEGVDDLERWRARFAGGLQRLVDDLPKWLPHAAQVLHLNHQNFLLAYQGGDDLPLQRAYSRFVGTLARHARPQWATPRRRTYDGARRVRVGFAGAIFHDCTAGRYFERWITGLDAARFERIVYHMGPASDALTQRIAAACDRVVVLRRGAEDALQRIAADELDVLVHPEVGMTPFSLLAASLRLAPAQAAAWGHPVTTGSEAVDHYFTCAAMEPADGASHYAEGLVPLPGLGVDYPMPAAAAPIERGALGLAAGKRLYACPQSLFKVHPAMDALVARIVAADPEAVVLFFQAPSREVTSQFAARVQRALQHEGVGPRGQLKFLPRMANEAFRRVLAACDVVIDTVHWSGGNTSLDAFAAGVPVVTLPGRFMRGRQTAGMLQLMGITQLVAADADAYVGLAVDVARDRERNAALRREIVERRRVLFDRPEPVAAFGEALLRMAAGESG